MAEKKPSFAEALIIELQKNSKGLSNMERRLLPSADRKGALYPYVNIEARNWIVSLLVMRDARRPSEIYQKHLSGLVKLCVAEKHQEEFYYALDEMNQFQMTGGLYRRSLRSKSYTPFVDDGIHLLWAYARLKTYGAELSDVLRGNVSSEIQKDAREESFCYGSILAAQIDRGDQEVIEAVKEILLGEQNTLMISHELIRGIVRSKNEALYQVLGDFLLAARLQEGARQAVCETMDAGRAEAFQYLFGIIEDHDLIRYSSVRRAVSTWIGIYEADSVERVANKLLKMMGRCLREPEFAEEQLRTEDSIGICCALWAKGFYNAEEAVQAIVGLAENGTKNQMMIASYYMEALQSRQLQQKAAKGIWFSHPGDLELAACYLIYFLGGHPCDLMGSLLECQSSGCYRYSYSPSYDKGAPPRQMTPKKLNLTEEEAKQTYKILKDMLPLLPKKGVDLHPCMLPSGYRVRLTPSDVAASMCLLAWVLQEDVLLDEAAGVIPLIGSGRHLAARLLLHRPQSDIRRNLLFELLKNPEEHTRNAACQMVRRLSLTKEDFRRIEANMRYKKSRSDTINLLKQQEPTELRFCICRLLKEKSEESHMGALELSLHLKKSQTKEYQKLLPVLEAYADPSEKEQLLLSELVACRKADTVQHLLNTPGYGLYNTKKEWTIPEVKVDTREAERLFLYGEDVCRGIFQKLEKLIEAHKEQEYKDFRGEEQLLGICLEWNRCFMNYEKDFPLRELWEDFYEKEIRTPKLLLEMYLYLCCLDREREYREEKELYQKVFGYLPYEKLEQLPKYEKQIKNIVSVLYDRYVPKELKGRWGVNGTARFYEVLKKEFRIHTADHRSNPIVHRRAAKPIFREMIHWLRYAPDKDWASAFALNVRIEMDIAFCVQAYVRGIWDKDMLYRAFFSRWELKELVAAVSAAELRTPRAKWSVNWHAVEQFFGPGRILEKSGQLRFDRMDASMPEMKLAHELYEELISLILKAELRRGEEETVFSKCISQIQVIYGADTLVQILKALGKEPLKRSKYGLYGTDRQTVFCQLLRVCHPREGETAESLKTALKGSSITKKRLVEAAMYARPWIPLMETYLNLPGFQSGCYYFIAHTSEGLDDAVMAMVAKYTPLSREELYDGAFDVEWFREAYEKLGKKEFQMLYDAAKYSAAGSIHARARKYADAALGIRTFEELSAVIGEKRNKDLLMSLPLLPLTGDREAQDRELFRRYQFIQNFLKESRQFGAQRRASEKRAAETALQNLSINAGFSDVTRLILRMESHLISEAADCFAWQPVEDAEIRVYVDENGKSSIQCQKEKKLLKSLPSKYKKCEAAVRCQEVHKRLKEQYQRTKHMFEQSMEDGTVFQVWELQKLMDNPVVRPVVQPLVFVQTDEKNRMGFLEKDGLRDWSGALEKISPETQVRAAHPWDLKESGHWHDYQRVLFEQKRKQPFKQIFRELYVKLPEEYEKQESRMFAGYQIQPRKTAAVLRGRRWVADEEWGLQKIYYKENIIAVIYALADWYSPGDIEAPVLEAVAFYDRKSFRSLQIKEIPDRLYSEVMRDVDLAVSTAYVGGVDPEASHSTVEMRRAIAAENLKLFRVKNVQLQENHALIDGKFGQYTVHLGSGVVHQKGNAMLHVLPVHSQHRGRIFLPFVDEDPKTAEILSKILLFAEDEKIKDPAVIRQITT